MWTCTKWQVSQGTCRMPPEVWGEKVPGHDRGDGWIQVSCESQPADLEVYQFGFFWRDLTNINQ